jgi:hypothetical protein
VCKSKEKEEKVMDYNALQHKLFAMDPVDPREDLAKLRGQATGDAPAVATEGVDYLKESAAVPEGSLQMDKDYSVSDFAALAGVKTEGKQKHADQVRGSEPMPAAQPERKKHPFQDRLVGEADEDRITQLERRIEALEAMLSERELSRGEEREKERIVKGMKKNRSDFEDRYGDDAEAVMYATATNRAKNESNIDSIKDSLYAALNKKMGV